MHKSLYEFEFQPDPTTDYGVICNIASKALFQLFLGHCLSLAGIEDIHIAIDHEFELRLYRTTYH